MRHHSEALKQLRDNEAIRLGLEKGEYVEALTEAEKSMLEWARRMTLRPSDAAESDADALRGLGWDDRAILDVRVAGRPALPGAAAC